MSRPTWAPAKGGNEQGGTRIFGPSQKYSVRDIASHTTLKPRKEGQETRHLLLEGSKRDFEERIVPRSADAADDDAEIKSDDESEDDTEALLAELQQIKKERAEDKLRKERQQQQEQLKVKEAELILGNPLLNNATSFNVKRRWDDDVVFKNQSRGETKTPKRFINDTIRSDFHRKGKSARVEFRHATAASADPSGAHTISRSFPHTYGQPFS